MTMKKVIAIDLDGTTLDQNSQISPRTENALRAAIESGYYVVIATGRPYRMSKHFYQQLNLHTPMTNFNGALVHLPEKKWLGEKETIIQREIAFDLLKQKEALGLSFVAAENKENFYIDDLAHFDPRLFASAASEQNLLTAAHLTHDPNSIMVETTRENAAHCRDEIARQFGEVVDVRTWGGPRSILEIVAKGVHKAVAVSYIADRLGVAQKNVMAFGDEHNDVELLSYAGWGVAMKNGTEQLKAVADDLTNYSNADDGLADYLENYFELVQAQVV